MLILFPKLMYLTPDSKKDYSPYILGAMWLSYVALKYTTIPFTAYDPVPGEYAAISDVVI